MKQNITMNWDSIQANGKMRKGKKGGAFISRNANYQVIRNTNRPKKIERPEISLEKTKSEIKEKDGAFFFSGRVNGRFARLEISESLAKKLS